MCHSKPMTSVLLCSNIFEQYLVAVSDKWMIYFYLFCDISILLVHEHCLNHSFMNQIDISPLTEVKFKPILAQYSVCASVQTTYTHTFQLHPGRQDGSCRSLECKGNRGKNMFFFPARGNECVAPFTTQNLWAVFCYLLFFWCRCQNDLSFKVALK